MGKTYTPASAVESGYSQGAVDRALADKKRNTVYGGKLASGTEYIGFGDFDASKHIPLSQEAAKEREMSAALGERISAKQELDSQNTQMGYTGQQNRKKQMLQNARAQIDFDFADDRLDSEQHQRLESQIADKEKAILPQKVAKQPTPLEQVQSRSYIDPVTQQSMYLDQNNEPKVHQGQMTNEDTLKLAAQGQEALKVEILDADGNGTGRFTPASSEQVAQYMADITKARTKINAALSGGQQGQQEQQEPQPTLKEGDAKYVGWVFDHRTGKGRTVDVDGVIKDHDQKPPAYEFTKGRKSGYRTAGKTKPKVEKMPYKEYKENLDAEIENMQKYDEDNIAIPLTRSEKKKARENVMEGWNEYQAAIGGVESERTDLYMGQGQQQQGGQQGQLNEEAMAESLLQVPNMTPELLDEAVLEEGSIQAVYEKLSRKEEKAPIAGRPDETKEEFLRGTSDKEIKSERNNPFVERSGSVLANPNYQPTTEKSTWPELTNQQRNITYKRYENTFKLKGWKAFTNKLEYAISDKTVREGRLATAKKLREKGKLSKEKFIEKAKKDNDFLWTYSFTENITREEFNQRAIEIAKREALGHSAVTQRQAAQRRGFRKR